MSMDSTAERDLIRRAKAGDAEARNAIILQYHPMLCLACRRACRRLGRQPDRYGELLGIAALRLLDMIQSFDPDHGTKLITYVSRFFDDDLVSKVRSQEEAPIMVARWQSQNASLASRGRRARALRPLSLDTETYVKSGRAMTLAEGLVVPNPGRDEGRAHEAREIIVRHLDRLAAKEWAVVRQRMCGLTLREISANMGLTKERVRQIEMRAVKRIVAAEMRSAGTGGAA